MHTLLWVKVPEILNTENPLFNTENYLFPILCIDQKSSQYSIK